MAIAPAALLEAGMGTRLPALVRDALIHIGVAGNDAVVALNSAHVDLQQAHSARAALHADSAPLPWLQQYVDDRVKAADAHYDRIAVVLARIATVYAVYASQVASAVVAGRTPAGPDANPVLPSQMLAAAGRLLPSITFPGDSEALADQNAEVAAARVALLAVIDDDLHAGSASRYDDPSSAETNAHAFAGELSDLPEALLTYASTLAWALSVHTGSTSPQAR